MIFDKEKIKQSMIEFTSDYYWKTGNHPRFKDYNEQYESLSVGTVNNYLKELCDTKKIQKESDNNAVYYILPKKHVTTKFFFIVTVTFILFLVTIAPILLLIKETISFYIGSIITVFFWRYFSKITT